MFLLYGILDSPIKWQIGFQEPAVPAMEGIVNFHNHVMIVILFIVIFVALLMLRTTMELIL